MPKIVYASPDISPDVWTPPPDVIVLPLSTHPAIVEDMAQTEPPQERRRYQWRNGPKRSPTVDRIIEYLRTHGPATTTEIAAALVMSNGNLNSILTKHLTVFHPVGEAPSSTNRWKTQTIWGLVKP